MQRSSSGGGGGVKTNVKKEKCLLFISKVFSISFCSVPQVFPFLEQAKNGYTTNSGNHQTHKKLFQIFIQLSKTDFSLMNYFNRTILMESLIDDCDLLKIINLQISRPLFVSQPPACRSPSHSLMTITGSNQA